MTLDAGKLDRRIVIIAPNPARSGPLNEMQDNPAPLATVWASKRTPSARERIQAGERGAEADAVFEIRFSNTVRVVDPTYQITHDGKTYEILGALEIGRREGIQLLCVGRNEGGLPEFNFGAPPPDYVPSLDFGDARNSMYPPLF